jgi:hypothetical protein
MKTFALLDENNIVINISVADDTWDSTGWIEYTQSKPAAIGYTYLPLEDIFIWPKCHNEAILNAKAGKWDCTNKDHDVKPLAE